jgi:eukaryotic-like serine/threonine-protein kinase
MSQQRPVNAISHYEIIRQLGAGGMGEVYLARDTKLGRQVAIKLVKAESLSDEQARKRLVREARAAATLDHPNICVVHEVGEENNHTFVVMQYVEGETLASRIRAKSFDLAELLDLAMQIADALAEAHSKGIVHRDIKPQNIIINRKGQVKVLDFGLAKVVRDPELSENLSQTESLMTTPGLIMGTVQYMSPEQAKGEPLDGRSDIFSLGIMLYEMATRRQPFTTDNVIGTISSILMAEPPPLTRFKADAPAALQSIVSKALAKDKQKRYQTARELLDDLKSLRQDIVTGANRFATSDQGDQQTLALTDGPHKIETDRAGYAPTVRLSPQTTQVTDFPAGNNKLYKKIAMVALPILIAAIAVTAYLLSGPGPAPIDSVAILPFVNESADPAAEYLGDGITESLIYSLSQLTDLKVRPRNSVFRYKGKDLDPKQVGREIDVRAVVMGRINQRGDGLVINAELVDARDNSVLWGASYNRKLADIIAVQEEITRQISEKLRSSLSADEKKRLAKRYTENTEAYQLYLKGRYHTAKETRDEIEKGIASFHQALDVDPNYALAYAGLADAFATSTWYLSPKEAMPKAKAAALKALEIDERLAEAHASLGVVKMSFDWDWAGAEREFKRAVELNRGLAPAHRWYGELLIQIGNPDQAIAEMKRAVELDPVSLVVTNDLGLAYLYARNYDQAIDQYRKSIDMDPSFVASHILLGRAYVNKAMYQEALGEFQKARQIDDGPDILADMGRCYAVSGNRGEAEKILAELKQLSARAAVSPYYFAIVYTGLGDKDQAFVWLDKAYEARSGSLGWIKLNPTFDALRSDPRFADLLRRIGLAQ